MKKMRMLPKKFIWFVVVLLTILILLISAGIFLPLSFSMILIFVGLVIMIGGYIVGGGVLGLSPGSEVSVGGKFVRVDPRWLKFFRDFRYYSAPTNWLIIYLTIIIGGVFIAAGIISLVIRSIL